MFDYSTNQGNDSAQLRVVTISGTPGTGKSVVAALIGEKLGASIWNLGDIAKQYDLLEPDDSARGAPMVDPDQLEVTLREEIPRATGPWLVIEGHYADVVPTDFVSLAVVLRCRPDVLWTRLSDRGYNEAKVKENVEAEILGDCTSYMLDRDLGTRFVEIDASDTNPEEIATILYEILAQPSLAINYPPGIIDWLQYLDERRELEKYLHDEWM